MESVKSSSEALPRLRKQGIGMIIMLSLQFLLGMITNLFVEFPQSDQAGGLWRFALSQNSIQAHIFIGVLLLGGGIVLAIRSNAEKIWIWRASSIIGLLGIVISIFGGVSFIPSQNDQYSLIMAIGFALAILAYSFGLFASQN